MFCLPRGFFCHVFSVSRRQKIEFCIVRMFISHSRCHTAFSGGHDRLQRQFASKFCVFCSAVTKPKEAHNLPAFFGENANPPNFPWRCLMHKLVFADFCWNKLGTESFLVTTTSFKFYLADKVRDVCSSVPVAYQCCCQKAGTLSSRLQVVLTFMDPIFSK